MMMDDDLDDDGGDGDGDGDDDAQREPCHGNQAPFT